MKKSLFLSVLIIAFATANTQTLFKEIHSIGYLSGTFQTYQSDYVAAINKDNKIEIFDMDFNLIKSLSLPNVSNVGTPYKNVYTNSNKIEFIVGFQENNISTYKLYNEEGTMLFDFGRYSPIWFLNNKLIAMSITFDTDNQMLVHNKIYTIYGNQSLSSTQLPSENLDKIQIYPNPSSGMINIEYNITAPTQMQIFDMSGRIIDSTPIYPEENKNKLNISNYKSGNYIVKIGNNQKIFTVN